MYRALSVDSRWFIEDREAARKDPSQDEKKLKEESEKALRNSTVFQRRLARILQDEFDKTLMDDENFEKQKWELRHISNISRRKTLREILNLINFKEV